MKKFEFDIFILGQLGPRCLDTFVPLCKVYREVYVKLEFIGCLDTLIPLCKVYREVYVKLEFIGSLTISCDRLLVNHSAAA